MPAFSPPRLRAVLTAALVIAAALVSARTALARGDGDATDKARDVLPEKFFRSVHYTIADDVQRSAFFYHFTVSSDYGTFDVASISMLRVRLHEIVTMAEVSPLLNRSKNALNRAPDGRRGVGADSVADILADPLGTAGTLIGNLAYNIEETFEEPGGDTDRSASFEGFDVDPGPHKRSAAAQLDVDVYSSNPALQRVLDSIAAARSAGKLRGPVAVTHALSIGPPVFGSGVLDNRIRSILKNQSAAEIHAGLAERLEQAGVTPDQRIAFLTNRSYTPRTRLYLVRFLAQLKHADGIGNVIHSANRARTEADAHAFVDLARMAAFHELTGHHVRRIISRRDFPVFITDAGVLVLALPVDHFSWNRENEDIVAALGKLAETEGAASTTILLSGRSDARMTAALADRGIRLRERYSFQDAR